MSKSNHKSTNKGGRPRVVMRAEDIEGLASMFCSVEDMQTLLDIPASSWNRRMEASARLRAALKKGQAKARLSLHRRLWERSQGADSKALTALIFLCKNELGYSDRVFAQVEDRREGAEAHELTREELQQIIRESRRGGKGAAPRVLKFRPPEPGTLEAATGTGGNPGPDIGPGGAE